MYKKLAKYYDLIYFDKDYKTESKIIKKLIQKYKKSRGKELLDVACGTGHHLEYLKSDFSCIGIDINNEMLNEAKQKVKKVIFKKADMVNFDLHKRFDVIMCLFSSIGYVRTYKYLSKAIQNFSRCLKAGGILLIEPWYNNPAFKPGFPFMSTYSSKNIKIARQSTSKVIGSLSVLRMHYLIAEKDKEVKHYSDEHELGLFDTSKTLKIMEHAGLRSKFFKNGLRTDRGLLIGVKRK